MSAEWNSAAALSVSEIVRLPSPLSLRCWLISSRNSHSTGSALHAADRESTTRGPPLGAAAAAANDVAKTTRAATRQSSLRGRGPCIDSILFSRCPLACANDDALAVRQRANQGPTASSQSGRQVGRGQSHSG